MAAFDVYFDKKRGRLLLGHPATPALLTQSVLAPISLEDSQELLAQGGFISIFSSVGCLGVSFGDDPGADPARTSVTRPTFALFVTKHSELGQAFDATVCRVAKVRCVQLTPTALCNNYSALGDCFVGTLFSVGEYDITLPLRYMHAPDEERHQHRELYCANHSLLRHLVLDPALHRNLLLKTFKGFAHLSDTLLDTPSSDGRGRLSTVLIGRTAILPSPLSPSVVELETCISSPTQAVSRLEVVFTPCEGVGTGPRGAYAHSAIANPIATSLLRWLQSLYAQLMVVRLVPAPALAGALDDISHQRGTEMGKQRGNSVFSGTDMPPERLADLAELGAKRFGHFACSLPDATPTHRQEGIVCTLGPPPSRAVLQRTASSLIDIVCGGAGAGGAGGGGGGGGSTAPGTQSGTAAAENRIGSANVAQTLTELLDGLPRGGGLWPLAAAGGRSKAVPHNVMAASDAVPAVAGLFTLPAWDTAAATALVRQAVEASTDHELIALALHAPAATWPALMAAAPVGFATAAAAFSQSVCLLVLCQSEALASVADVRVAHTSSAVGVTLHWRARSLIFVAVAGPGIGSTEVTGTGPGAGAAAGAGAGAGAASAAAAEGAVRAGRPSMAAVEAVGDGDGSVDGGDGGGGGGGGGEGLSSAARAVLTALAPLQSHYPPAEVLVLAQSFATITMPVLHVDAAVKLLLARGETAVLAAHGAAAPTDSLLTPILQELRAAGDQAPVATSAASSTAALPGLPAVWKQIFVPAAQTPPTVVPRTLTAANSDVQVLAAVTTAGHSAEAPTLVHVVIDWLPAARAAAIAALAALDVAFEVCTSLYGVVAVTPEIEATLATVLTSECRVRRLPDHRCAGAADSQPVAPRRNKKKVRTEQPIIDGPAIASLPATPIHGHHHAAAASATPATPAHHALPPAATAGSAQATAGPTAAAGPTPAAAAAWPARVGEGGLRWGRAFYTIEGAANPEGLVTAIGADGAFCVSANELILFAGGAIHRYPFTGGHDHCYLLEAPFPSIDDAIAHHAVVPLPAGVSLRFPVTINTVSLFGWIQRRGLLKGEAGVTPEAVSVDAAQVLAELAMYNPKDTEGMSSSNFEKWEQDRQRSVILRLAHRRRITGDEAEEFISKNFVAPLDEGELTSESDDDSDDGHHGRLHQLRDNVGQGITQMGQNLTNMGGRVAHFLKKKAQRRRATLDHAALLDICFSHLERLGLEEEGLYRVVGVKSRVADLSRLLFKKGNVEALDSPDLAARTIASMIKKYYVEMPEPVIPLATIPVFLTAARQPIGPRGSALRAAIGTLPAENQTLLRPLLGHLARVAAHSSVNKMTPSNIGVVFGPTLTKFAVEDVSQLQSCNLIVETLVAEYANIFPTAGCPPPPPPRPRGYVPSTPRSGAASEQGSAAALSIVGGAESTAAADPGAHDPAPAQGCAAEAAVAAAAEAAAGAADLAAYEADTGVHATVLYDYTANTFAELSVLANARVHNVHVLPDGWAVVSWGVHRGFLPASYLQPSEGDADVGGEFVQVVAE